MRLIMKTLWQVARTCLIAASLTLTGWTALAAPEPWERRALDLPNGPLEWKDRRALREMRVLRLAMNVAPGLMVDIMSYTAPEVPRAMLAEALKDAAEGRTFGPVPPSNQNTAMEMPARRVGGAKFLRVE